MWRQHARGIGSLLAMAALSLGGCGCSAPPTTVSGVVLDAATNKPLAGVFVMAVYTQGASSGGHATTRCTGTRGITTAADGRYSFPVGRPNSPDVMALALDAVEDRSKEERRFERTWNGLEPLPARDLVFIDRALAKPGSGWRFLCGEAESPSDLEANRAYLRMMLAINEKYPAWYDRKAILGALAFLDKEASRKFQR